MIKAAAGLFVAVITSAAPMDSEPHSFFRNQIGLTDDQIAMIGRGEPIVKVLPSRNPLELFVFGAVFVNAAPEAYVALAFDMNRLRKSPNYLGVGRFSDPPLLSDLNGFALEPDDIASLRTCKPGKCGVQLPVDKMAELRSGLDNAAPQLAAQVNARAPPPT